MFEEVTDDMFADMFQSYFDDGWDCEFGDPQGVWISPDGTRYEPDAPESPLFKLGLI